MQTPSGAGLILDAWPSLVDRRVGIVRQVTELPVDDDEPNFYHYLSTACDTSAFAPLKNFGSNGGVGITRRRAIAKALGEAVERYCSAIFTESDLVWGCHRDLAEEAVSPGAFALYRTEDYESGRFPWHPFDEGTYVAWVRGRSLADQSPRLVPAATVYVPYHYYMSRGDTPIMQPISTGLACGSSRAAAALSGLCEAIERDAFTITWQAQLSRPRIDQSSLPAEVVDLVERYEQVGLTVEMMDITTDIGCPVIMTVAVGRASSSPALAVAAACDPSPLIAALKSLEELAHTRKYAAQLMDYTPPVPLDAEADHPAVESQREHLRLWCPQETLPFAEFLWSSDERIPLEHCGSVRIDGEADAEALLDCVAGMVQECDLEPILFDLTTPDVRSLGLSAVRVVVPGLHPLFMGHANRATGGRRLCDVPPRLGMPGLSVSDAGNPFPHPFP